MSSPATPAADTATLREQRDAAVALLRDAPGRHQVTSDIYWSWRRRVEAYIKTVEPADVEAPHAN